MAHGFTEYPPRTGLPDLALHESTNRDEIVPVRVARSWVDSLNHYVNSKDEQSLSGLFYSESWWRDLAGLKWDFASKKGPAAISKYVIESSVGLNGVELIQDPPLCPVLVDMGPMTVIQFGFTFHTNVGSGRGIVRLGNNAPGSWKAWTVSTQLETLHTNDAPATNGLTDDDLEVLVIGGGQSGLTIAAQLQHLKIRYLVFERNPRSGDAWRQRYQAIRSHTASYSDHFPFLSFPTDMPRWLKRDDIANWIDHYGNNLDLNVMFNASVLSICRDNTTGNYAVSVSSNGAERTYKAKQVVLASGMFSNKPLIPDIPQRSSFGGAVYHSAEHKSAAETADLANKIVVVVGAGTSGHDIAQDFVAHGAKGVAIVQRSRMVHVSTDSLEKFQLNLWSTPGVDTEEADLLANSMPTILGLTLGSSMMQAMAANDKELLDGLEKAGVALGRGEDGIGLLDHQLIKAGHFYIDQGAAQMILDGRIKVHRCSDGIKEFCEDGLVLGNGQKIQADVVVLATGFQRIIADLQGILKDEDVLEKIRQWGGFDDDYERKGYWRPMGISGLWYMTGSFIWCRQFSKLLALQIQAFAMGLNLGHAG